MKIQISPTNVLKTSLVYWFSNRNYNIRNLDFFPEADKDLGMYIFVESMNCNKGFVLKILNVLKILVLKENFYWME